jgi:hypothetical protein
MQAQTRAKKVAVERAKSDGAFARSLQRYQA